VPDTGASPIPRLVRPFTEIAEQLSEAFMAPHPPHGQRHSDGTGGHTIGWWAPFYDAMGWLMSFGRLSGMRQETLRVAGLQPGESVLDVGCGTGVLTRLAARKVAPSGHAVGIDASPQMIATAQRKAGNVSRLEFHVAAIEQLPLETGTFDVVLSSLMLHHLPDDLKKSGLSEVRRVLKPGGRLVVVDLTRAHRFLGHVAGHQLPEDYPDRLRRLLADSGFDPVEPVETKYGQLLFIRALAATAPSPAG
jgi:ubiquinone/menaquinone biosynthesis C-methylase UbiE